jgi:hypothetical protein
MILPAHLCSGKLPSCFDFVAFQKFVLCKIEMIYLKKINASKYLYYLCAVKLKILQNETKVKNQ